MNSSNMKYLAKLDHLRFIAAMLVVIHHFIIEKITNNMWTSDLFFVDLIILWIKKGTSGVSLFLVLSGFLFTLIVGAGAKKIIYHKFIYNRVLRIFPLVTILIMIVIMLNRNNSNPIDILRLFTLQLNTGGDGSGWGNNIFPSGPIWTVAVEFQFYLIFPIIMLFFTKYGIRWIITLISFFLLLKVMVFYVSQEYGDIHNPYWDFYHSILGRLDQFVIGIAYGIWYKTYDKKMGKIVAIATITLSILGLTILFKNTNTIDTNLFASVFSFTLEAVLWGGIIIGYLSMQFQSPMLGRVSKVLAFLGGISFSIYLLHVPTGFFINKLMSLYFEGIGDWIALFIKMIVVILVSSLSFYAIEKPFMGLRVKYLSDR